MPCRVSRICRLASLQKFTTSRARLVASEVAAKAEKASSAENLGRLLASVESKSASDRFSCPARSRPSPIGASELPGVVQGRPSAC
jgi:hypothetical protein